MIPLPVHLLVSAAMGSASLRAHRAVVLGTDDLDETYEAYRARRAQKRQDPAATSVAVEPCTRCAYCGLRGAGVRCDGCGAPR